MPDLNIADAVDAWWFAASDRLPHGDNREIVVGGRHSLEGEILICRRALHASRHPMDALSFAPGPYLYRVRVWGDLVEQGDKIGGRHREYIAMRDATEMLRRFARECASDVLHLWDAPQVVRDYLATGNAAIRTAAMAAADASRDAAMDAAWDAARDAAWDAARYAAGAAAGAAGGAAARATHRKRFAALVNELFSEEAL